MLAAPLIFAILLVTALLSFGLGWLWHKTRWDKKHLQARLLEQKLLGLQNDYQGLVRHSNQKQEKLSMLKQEKRSLEHHLKSSKSIIEQLEADKDFIFREYEQFRLEVKQKLGSNQKLVKAFEELQEKNQKSKLKTDKWKVRYYDALDKLRIAEQQLRRLKREQKQWQEQVQQPDQSKAVLEWESNYKELKLRFLALSKEKKDLDLQVKDIEARLEAQQKQVQSQAPKNDRSGSLLARIRQRTKLLDFDRIGHASSREKDNLKQLKGMGPSLEKRFHAIGLYQFKQLASLNPFEEELLNILLELSAGKIQREKWVEQARQLAGIADPRPQQLTTPPTPARAKSAIGASGPVQKDNLQLIRGIGPYIEQRLNALGIFRFQQLTQLRPEDLQDISESIALAPGQIEADDWVGQAERLK